MFSPDSPLAFESVAVEVNSTPHGEGVPSHRRGTIVEADARSRPQFEAFIAQRYAEVHGAQLYCFMPRLFGLYHLRRELVAAFGLRGADAGGLFLERYLDSPIEHLVTARFGRPALRNEIAEIGNLAGASPDALRNLIPALTYHLRDEGYRYVAFTGSARLCKGFSRLGLPLRMVAQADAKRLPIEERRRWGSYYAHSPSVMLGDVAEGHRLLRAMEGEPACLLARFEAVARVGAP
ncbi:MAG: thermostable hemolysin [Panacagrimonas sp.]